MLRLDTLELQLALIRLGKGMLRAWEEWVRRRIRELRDHDQKKVASTSGGT